MDLQKKKNKPLESLLSPYTCQKIPNLSSSLRICWKRLLDELVLWIDFRENRDILRRIKVHETKFQRRRGEGEGEEYPFRLQIERPELHSTTSIGTIRTVFPTMELAL